MQTIEVDHPVTELWRGLTRAQETGDPMMTLFTILEGSLKDLEFMGIAREDLTGLSGDQVNQRVAEAVAHMPNGMGKTAVLEAGKASVFASLHASHGIAALQAGDARAAVHHAINATMCRLKTQPEAERVLESHNRRTLQRKSTEVKKARHAAANAGRDADIAQMCCDYQQRHPNLSREQVSKWVADQPGVKLRDRRIRQIWKAAENDGNPVQD